MKTYNERLEEIQNRLISIAQDLNELACDATCKSDYYELIEISNMLDHDIYIKLADCKY